jgi:hypothetical protein
MKINSYSLVVKLSLSAIILIITFTKCNTVAVNESNCNGYTGDVTNKAAKVLMATCHFMGKDSIDSWTIRYQKNKANIGSTSLPTVTSILSDSCSFNSSIVRAIITNDSCIGLRVINGMDASNKVHVLLVGIQPDYTTLYIKKPKDCAVKDILNQKDATKDDDPDDELGGGEMGIEP